MKEQLDKSCGPANQRKFGAEVVENGISLENILSILNP